MAKINNCGRLLNLPVYFKICPSINQVLSFSQLRASLSTRRFSQNIPASAFPVKMSTKPIGKQVKSASSCNYLTAGGTSLESTNTDDWSKFAKTFTKLAIDGPGVYPAQNMVEITNAVRPIASALTVLDIGCGVGQVISAVLQAHGSELPASSRVVASDMSPGMLEQVQKRKTEAAAKGDKLWDKVETLLCDAKDLSAFEDGSVSHAYAGFVLFMVPEARTAMKEIHRVLTNQNGGGVFSVSSWMGSEWQDLMSIPSKVRPDKMMGKMPETWRTIEGVRGELEATGFRDIEVHTLETYMPFEDYDQLVGGMITEFPIMVRMMSDMTEQEVQKTRELMVEYIKSKHPQTPSRLKGTAIVGMGRK